ATAARAARSSSRPSTRWIRCATRSPSNVRIEPRTSGVCGSVLETNWRLGRTEPCGTPQCTPSGRPASGGATVGATPIYTTGAGHHGHLHGDPRLDAHRMAPTTVVRWLPARGGYIGIGAWVGSEPPHAGRDAALRDRTERPPTDGAIRVKGDAKVW